MARPVPRPARVATLAVEVSIAAPPARVWRALVSETAAWWRGAFLTTGPSSRFRVEARPGGRLWEDAGRGRGLLWAHVVRADAPSRLEFVGDISPAWGGPVRFQTSIRLEDAPGGTTLRLEDALVGNATPRLVEALEDGWTLLLGTMLRAHVERAGPARTARPAARRRR